MVPLSVSGPLAPNRQNRAETRKSREPVVTPPEWTTLAPGKCRKQGESRENLRASGPLCRWTTSSQENARAGQNPSAAPVVHSVSGPLAEIVGTRPKSKKSAAPVVTPPSGPLALNRPSRPKTRKSPEPVVPLCRVDPLTPNRRNQAKN